MWSVGPRIGIVKSVLRSLDLQNQPPRRHYNRALLTSCGNADILLLENSTPPHAKPSVLSSDGKKKRRRAKSVTKRQREKKDVERVNQQRYEVTYRYQTATVLVH
jgi:hypothetical protein